MSLFKQIAFDFTNSDSKKKKLLFLSGGKTIKKIYADYLWRKFIQKFDFIAFTDERIVPRNSEHSNVGSLLKFIPEVQNRIVFYLDESGDFLDGYECIISDLLFSKKIEKFAISGFGEDGHFWSLFSYSDFQSDQIILKTSSPSHSFNRITLGSKTLELLDFNYFFCDSMKYNKYLEGSVNGLIRTVNPEIFTID